MRPGNFDDKDALRSGKPIIDKIMESAEYKIKKLYTNIIKSW